MRSASLRSTALVAFIGVMLQSFASAAAFKSPSTFAAHLAPIAIAVADFNGDGNLDIAMANRSSNDISVLLGKGNGTFGKAANYTVGTGGPDPVAIVAADVNSDGKPDLIVADLGTNKVTVLLNSGTGTFNAPVTYSVGNLPSGVAVADLNGDGFPDIAVTNSGDNTVSILINSGTGTFTAGGTYGTDTNPSAIVIADFNGDGLNDLAISNQGGNDVSILLNQGGGTFSTATNYCVVTTSGSCNSVTAVFPVALVAVDLNGDNKIDLAVASLGSSVATLLNNGSGAFTLTATATSSQRPQAIASGVYVSGGSPSLVVADYASNSFEIYGDSNGNLSGPLSYFSGSGAIAIAAGDFNNDRKLDVAVVNNNDNDAAVILGNGDGTFTGIENFIAGTNTRALALGDFNNDGKTDFLANSSGANNSVSLFTGNGKGVFTQSATVGFSSDVYSIAVGDFNQDKNLDFVVANETANQVSVVFGNGNGTFNSSIASYATDADPMSVAVADFNHDGYPDIVTANSAGNDISILLNTKTGSFNAAVNLPAGTNPDAVAAADLNNDGYPDIVVANFGSANVTVFMNKEDGTFSAGANYTVGNGPIGLAIADLNGDHYADLIVTNKNDSSISVLLGNGDGTFQTQVAYTIPNAGLLSTAVADITADGIPDLVVAESFVNSVGVLQGNGNGTFQGSVNYRFGVTPFAVATNDVNGDGKPDVLVANYAGGDVTVLLDQSPAAVMSASPTKLAFGNVQVGSSSTPLTLTLTNKGNLTLNISTIITSADFPMNTTCGTTLPPLATCTVAVTYSPTFPGPVIGQLTFAGSVTGNDLIIPLTGTGQFPVAVAPASMKFAATAVGKTSAPQTVTVYNQLSTAQSLTFTTTGDYNASASGTSPCTGVLSGNSSCTVSVTLSPTQSGAINGSFIVSGSGFLPQITSLSGTGTGGPVVPLSFSPTSLLFDSPALGFSSLPKPVTATNTTASPLNLTLTASTDWTVSGLGANPCGGTLAAGASCQFAVVFTPSVLGYFNGSISISTGSGNPVLYDLEGLGNLDSSFTPSLIQFSPQTVGTTSPGVVVKVWNFENTNMTVLGWYTSGDYSAVPGTTQPCAVNGQVPPLLKPYCTLVVSFSPTRVGPINGSLTVITSWATGAESLPLTGTGQ